MNAGYVVVALIAGILVWQAMIHLGSKKRKRTSLIGAFTIDDIEVSDGPIQSRAGTTQSLLTARVDYQDDLAPFPTSHPTTVIGIEDNREGIEGQITTLREAAIERYSVRERSGEKVSECKELIVLIRDLVEQYNADIDEEILNAPLEGLTLAELEIRQTILLEIYDHLYQHSFEEEVQKIRRRELELQASEGEDANSEISAEMSNLRTTLESLRREEELYREIQSAKTLQYLESLDLSGGLDEDATERLQSHFDFYHSRLSEIERLHAEADRYEHHSNAILDSEDKDELIAMKFDGVNSRMRAELEDRREKRIAALSLRDLKVQEDANAAELRLEIESAPTSRALDMIRITGVNTAQEDELKQLFAIKRQSLLTEEYRNAILGCEYVLELDALSLEGINTEQFEELQELRNEKRLELVEFARLMKFNEEHTKYLDMIPRIDDIEELLEVEIENVSSAQKEELEDLRLSRLDYLQEMEDQRIEREQAENYQNIRKALESSKTSTEAEEILIEDVNEEQEEKLLEIKEEVIAILIEDEKITQLVEKAEKKAKKEPKTIEFEIDHESTFRTRVKTLGAKDGLLRLSLIWDNMNDLDLIVKTSKGEIIHRGSRTSSCGGNLDLEMNSQPEVSAAMENIVWANGKIPPEGKYKIFIWHRNRHQKLRRTDPTEYILRVKIGAEYYQYKGKTSFGDDLHLIATADVPDSTSMQARMDAESQLYQESRKKAKLAKSSDDFPEISDELSSLHKVMLARIMEKRTAEWEEKAREELLAKQEAELTKVLEAISAASDLDELSAIRYDDVSEEAINSVEKAITKQKKAIESGLKKQASEEERQKVKEFKEQINQAQTLTDLSSIVFEGIGKRHADALQKMRVSKRKVLQSKMSADDVERDKQDRLHKALNEAYSRGGLQALPDDEWRSNEFAKRLEEVGASSGGVQISLLWDNKNDFNLLVITPSREVIHPRSRESSDGGFQDIEMNEKGESKTPIENVYWPEGKEPKGGYYVYVHFYREHQTFRRVDISECRIQIINQGKRTEYAAQMSLSNKLQFVTMIKVE